MHLSAFWSSMCVLFMWAKIEDVTPFAMVGGGGRHGDKSFTNTNPAKHAE